MSEDLQELKQWNTVVGMELYEPDFSCAPRLILLQVYEFLQTLCRSCRVATYLGAAKNRSIRVD